MASILGLQLEGYLKYLEINKPIRILTDRRKASSKPWMIYLLTWWSTALSMLLWHFSLERRLRPRFFSETRIAKPQSQSNVQYSCVELYHVTGTSWNLGAYDSWKPRTSNIPFKFPQCTFGAQMM